MAPERSPSRKALQLLDLVIAFRQEHGFSPSIRELMSALNLRSPSGIQHRLRSLRAYGLITWSEGTSRSLRPISHRDCSVDSGARPPC